MRLSATDRTPLTPNPGYATGTVRDIKNISLHGLYTVIWTAAQVKLRSLDSNSSDASSAYMAASHRQSSVYPVSTRPPPSPATARQPTSGQWSDVNEL